MKKKYLFLFVCLVSFILVFTSVPAFAQAQKTPKKVSIQLLALRFGTLGYTSTFSLAELINKNSKWLQATAVETNGTIANARVLAEDPAKRKNTVILNDVTVQYLAETGKPPFKAPYKGLRAISLAYQVAGAFVTLDPKIKTGQDLAGKRVGVGKKGSTSALWPEIILKNGWEVWDKLKSVHYVGYSESYDALRAGTLDVALFNPILPGSAPGALKEFMESVPAFYIIPVPPDIIKKARVKSGYPIYPTSMKANALGPRQKKGYDGYAFTIGWWADKDLPDDIAYEICRVLNQHYKDLWQYDVGLKGINPETMGLAAGDAKYFHPGALKYYKENKIKVGE